MPRLGELLVAAGVIGPAQLEDGLRAQVIHGARLGTNLVELGHLELDVIAEALARQHRMPPALRRHFERCNPAVQARLPADLAARHTVVPIGLLADNVHKVLIAATGPLAPAARTELELAMRLAPGGLVVAVAAELRVLYFLERVYGVPRANRFLRIRRVPGEDATGRFTPVPAAPPDDEDSVEIDLRELGRHADEETTASRPRATVPFEPPDDFHIDETPVDHIIEPPAPGTSWRRPRDPEPVPAPPEMVPAPVERPLELGGEELRRFVETLGETQSALGRIAIRKVELKSSGDVREAAEIARVLGPDSTIEEVARAIRRAQSRDRVGELAVRALRRFGNDLDAAVLFVVREAVALGWKGFSAGVEDLAVDALAIPLDAPTVLASAIGEGRALLIDGAHGTPIDRRLFAALGKPDPGEVAVAPITLAGHTVGLLYGQVSNRARMAPMAEVFAAVQQAITSAFARLLRAAQR